MTLKTFKPYTKTTRGLIKKIELKLQEVKKLKLRVIKKQL